MQIQTPPIKEKVEKNTVLNLDSQYLHGKSIDIGSYRNKRRTAGPDIADNACNCNRVLVGDVQLIQLFSDKPTGLEFFETKFWVLMYSPSYGNHPIHKVWLHGTTEKISGDMWPAFGILRREGEGEQ